MSLNRLLLALLVVIALPAGTALSAPSRELAAALKSVRAVGPEGQGNAAASAAWPKVAGADIKSLPSVLGAMDGANDYALNWLRTAVDAISSRALEDGERLPLADLNKFLADTRHHPRARRLAYELIARVDTTASQRLLPTFLNDPSNELRRDAVQQVIEQATKALDAPRKDEAIASFRKALAQARDPDQIDAVAKKLRELGQTVDLQQTFGWVTKWKLIGPFDNTGGKGFDIVYPPEQVIDLKAEYDGKTNKVRWVDTVSTNDYGLIDFNKPLGQLKGVAGYATTEFFSDKARPVEIRLGCKNGWKVWLNGKFLFGRDEYHRNMEIDQYRLASQLRPGRNVILVKCCQNEQIEDWTVEWEFQMRLTDAQGTPIFSSQ
jgi:hypothetical protein